MTEKLDITSVVRFRVDIYDSNDKELMKYEGFDTYGDAEEFGNIALGDIKHLDKAFGFHKDLYFVITKKFLKPGPATPIPDKL